eukprot:scaffold18144_cov130-Isochrysis_galbana.AAC.6
MSSVESGAWKLVSKPSHRAKSKPGAMHRDVEPRTERAPAIRARCACRRSAMALSSRLGARARPSAPYASHWLRWPISPAAPAAPSSCLSRAAPAISALPADDDCKSSRPRRAKLSSTRTVVVPTATMGRPSAALRAMDSRASSEASNRSVCITCAEASSATTGLKRRVTPVHKPAQHLRGEVEAGRRRGDRARRLARRENGLVARRVGRVGDSSTHVWRDGHLSKLFEQLGHWDGTGGLRAGIQQTQLRFNSGILARFIPLTEHLEHLELKAAVGHLEGSATRGYRVADHRPPHLAMRRLPKGTGGVGLASICCWG